MKPYKEHSKVTEQRPDKCFMNCLMSTVSNQDNNNTSAALLADDQNTDEN